jgi:mannitol 2-dehydrogenase
MDVTGLASGTVYPAQRRLEQLALVVSSWARYAEGVDEQGERIDIVDRVKERVTAAAARQREGDDLAFLRDRDLFGDLVDDGRFTAVYRDALAALHEKGARETLQAWSARITQ